MATVRRGFVLLVVLMLATPVVAHVPSFPTDNTAPERAVEVPDAAKSWSFYDSLDDGAVTYYRLTVQPGERLQVGTFTPLATAFRPSIVVMSPSVTQSGQVPPGVTVPDGMGSIVVQGTRPNAASYEPFAPSANYPTTAFTRRTDGETTYLIAIYEPANRSGPVGVTIGYREEFSPVEYVRVPFDLVQTHRWEGQHLLVVIGPLFLTLLGGSLVVSRRRPDTMRHPVVRYGVAGAGLLLVGTGVNTAFQMVLALSETGLTLGAVVTAVFVAVPVFCGGWVLRVSVRRELPLRTWTRVGLALAGLAGLVTWAGYILGPVVLLAVAALPRRFTE